MKTALDYPQEECRRLYRKLYGFRKTERDPMRRIGLSRDLRWLSAGIRRRTSSQPATL